MIEYKINSTCVVHWNTLLIELLTQKHLLLFIFTCLNFDINKIMILDLLRNNLLVC